MTKKAILTVSNLITDQEAISKKFRGCFWKFINGVNKVLITEKIEKIKKNIKDFFKGLRQFFLKFNYPQAISI